MNAWLVLAAAVVAVTPVHAGDSDGGSDCVVLLHGMARTERAMRPLAGYLREHGYTVVNEGYPSRQHPIETLAPMAIDTALAACEREGRTGNVHFVTHSLGGILVRYYVEQQPLPQLGRVVMLAPPNQGSAAADKWRGIPGFDWLNGPAGRQLGKGKNSVPLSLGPATFEVGIIAGDRTIDPITSAMLENPDDGRVSVTDTHLEGMQDFRQVHATHAFMMRNREVMQLTLNFLRHGKFDVEDSQP